MIVSKVPLDIVGIDVIDMMYFDDTSNYLIELINI